MSRNTVHSVNTFTKITNVVILVNVGLVIYGFADHTHEELLEHLHIIILGYFVIELAVRLHESHWNLRRFFKDPWAIFDTLTVILSLLPDLLGATALRTARLAKFARFAHLARHATALRAIELPAARRRRKLERENQIAALALILATASQAGCSHCEHCQQIDAAA